MNTAHLSIDYTPPIEVPYRFFLTAPVFGGLFSLLLMFAGETLLESRWSLTMIGALHLLTIGVLLMVVIGVLFQLLPVVGGVQIPWQRKLSIGVHSSMSAALVLFAIGSLFSVTALFIPATILFVVALTPYLGALLVLYRKVNSSEFVTQLRFIYPFLVLFLLLGLQLLAGWGGLLSRVTREWTHIHLLWGLGGWFTLLLMAASFQMIPMFLVTDEFPRWLRKWLIPTVAVALYGWGIGEMVGVGLLSNLLMSVVASGLMLFGVVALKLIIYRKRRMVDSTIHFWVIALGAMVVSGTVLLVSQWLLTDIPAWLGLFHILIVLLPMLAGSLLKITPFLVFLHLQQRAIQKAAEGGRLSPPMSLFQILPASSGRRLLYLYLSSLFLLIIAIFYLPAVHLAGFALLLFFSWFGWIVHSCYHVYNTNA